MRRSTEREGEQVDVERSPSDTQTILDDLVLQQFGPTEKPIAQVLGVKGVSAFVRTDSRCFFEPFQFSRHTLHFEVITLNARCLCYLNASTLCSHRQDIIGRMHSPTFYAICCRDAEKFTQAALIPLALSDTIVRLSVRDSSPFLAALAKQVS